MGILDRIKSAVAALRSDPATEKAPWTVAWSNIFQTGLDTLPWFTSSLTQPYAQHPTVYAAVSAIASNLAALPLEFFPESDTEHETPDPDALPLMLIRKPNPLMAGTQLIEATIVNLELYGNAFWFKDGEARRSATGPRFPTVLDCWDPCKVRSIMDGDVLKGWEYRTQNTTRKVSTDRVLHFKFFNPYDPVIGLGPLQAAQIVANADYKAGIWNQSFFDNHAMPYGVITPKQNQIIDKDAMVRLRDQMEARHGGAAKHGRLGTTNIPMDFLQIGMDQKDMDFATLLDKATEKILMVWKVPPAVAGVMKDANYNAQIAQAKQFWHNHMPTLNYIEEVIYQGLCIPYSIKLRPYFKTESIAAFTEDQGQIAERARQYFGMGVPLTVLNNRLGLGFDLKDIEDTAELSFLTFSNVPAEQLVQSGASVYVDNPAEQGAPPQPQNMAGDESTVAEDTSQGKSLPNGRELVRRMNWRLVISNVRTEEMAMTSLLRQHFQALMVEVLRKLRGEKAPASFSVDIVMFDDEKADRDLRIKTEPVVRSSIKAGLDSIARVIGIDFTMLTPGVQKFLAEKMFEIHELVDGPAEERLRATLQEGLAKGESIEKISDRVEEVFAVERSRARRIARTEVAEAFNAGRYDAMKVAEVKRIEWLTARDDRVRDSHRDLDGDIVTLGDRFKNGLLYPLDPNGPPEEVVNCRCVALPA